jgi:predicted PurR-regulated permease PerM
MKRTYTSNDSRLLGVVIAVVVVATLFFARVVFIPLALALLFSLLLTPVVVLLERIKLPRILAIILVVATLVGSLGLMAWRASEQFIELSGQLPIYEKALQDKIHSVKGARGQGLNKVSNVLNEIEKELVTAAPTNAARKAAPPGSSEARPLPVEVVPPSNPFQSVQNLLGPIGTAGLVTIFTIFMLIGREDLRNRFIRLVGGGRLNVMTQALDEATRRVNRYLLMQLIVNAVYGVVIGTALHFIGIPNASLWAVAAAILRFLPYVGAPMAALMPVVLSVAVFPGWYHALATAGLYLFLELVVGNLIEPFLYGVHVGLSALAILVAAVFWTLIWGLPGLVLSTPLTVCLLVMGRYVPGLSFLHILLGDEPVLSPDAQYYQRLLAADQNEARQVAEQYLKEKSLDELYSSVVIPALSLAEKDRHRNQLDEETQNFIFQSTREIAEELDDTSAKQLAEETPEASSHPTTRNASRRLDVLCVPARDDADDVVGMLLAQLLERHGHSAESISIGPTSEMLSQVEDANPRVVCISALPPFALNHARALYAKLRAHEPGLHIVVCLWHFEGDPQKAAIRLRLVAGDGFFTTVPQVLQHIASRAEPTTGHTGQTEECVPT